MQKVSQKTRTEAPADGEESNLVENAGNGQATEPAPELVAEVTVTKVAKPSETAETAPSVDADKARTAEIVTKGTELYEFFKSAGFSRDSFIELGESCKKGIAFKQVHPVVQRLIMKVAKQVHKL